MLDPGDKVKVIGKIFVSKRGKKSNRRARGWNATQTDYLGKTGIVLGPRQIRGEPLLYDVRFADGKILGYQEEYLEHIKDQIIKSDLSF